MNSELAEELLFEIRDLTAIVAEALRPQYNHAVLKRIGERASELRALVRSEKRWEAVALMDGRRPQSEICSLSGMDQPSVSKLTKRLEQAGFVTVNDGRPRCIFNRWEIEAIRASTND